MDLGGSYLVLKDKNMVDTYRVYTKVGDVVVTVQVSLKDRELGEGMIIKAMAVTPSTSRGAGHGTAVLQHLLKWANRSEVSNIWAVQVQEESEGFWQKNGFVKVGNRTNDFRYGT